jgi:protoporphyrinogen oxidase
MNIPRWNIGIIGGGPGGLFTAYRLEQLCSTPLNISIFESSNRLGGKLLTEQFTAKGIQYEAGAAEFYDYSLIDEDPLRELIEHFGLQTQSMGGTSIVQENKVLGTIEDAHDSLGEGALHEFLRFNNRAKSEVSPRQFYDGTSTSHISAWGTSLQEERFSTSLDRLPNKTKKYIQQHIHSDLAAEPAQTSHRYGLDNYLMNDPAYMQLYSITGGNDLLVQALACRLSADVRLNTKVTTVKKGSQNTLELSWNTDDGHQSEEFDAVVVALPIDPLKKLVFLDSSLASAVQNHIVHHDHPADYLRITILFEKPFWKSWLHDSYCMLDAFDGCCLYDESSRIPEAQHGILGWLLGGTAAQEMAKCSDEELISAAINSLPSHRDEAKKLFCEAKIHRWLGAVSAQPGGFQQRGTDAKHCPDAGTCPHLLVVGDYLFDSTLNGVLDSADYAAGWITTMAAAQE